MIRAAAALAVLLATCAGARQVAADPVLEPLDLYSGRTVVSGMGEPNREAGTEACLVDVLVKVSGDVSLAADPRVPGLAREASRQVVGYRYRDRLEGRPIHDEQGTYDRPHYLTVSFDPEAVRRDLEQLGRQPWTGPRPTVVVALSVRGRKGSFRLASDEDIDVSADMRAALAAAGEKLGLPVTVPPAAAQQDPAGSVRLAGELVWSDEALGWIARWEVRHAGQDARWSVRGVNFDEAFRVGLRGVAQVLSGHGPPP